MDDNKAKQQIVDKIKSSTNILVTVSNDPSVDALSAALGLTLLLDKLEKHPTAVFSGQAPSTIEFLEPEKTFDTTTDSLRDFIIALDKEKADHLRYKVEGDSVKIFITPYKTTITDKDLVFSQGDYNVELVIALGVDNQDHLDNALEAHGQILHDAAIITVTADTQTSQLGGIDWHDDAASSLSEMVAELAQALKGDKNKSLLDAPIATAFLTGIVAETDRFSNNHTTSRVMTTAAQLMAAGADQQLIATKLQTVPEPAPEAVSNDAHSEPQQSSQSDQPGGDNKSDADTQAATDTPESEDDDKRDTLSISHDPNETLEELDKRVKEAEQAEAAEVAEKALQQQQDKDKTDGSIQPSKAETAMPDKDDSHHEDDDTTDDEPSFGGTLNATAEQAAEDARREENSDRNKRTLEHSGSHSEAHNDEPTNAYGDAPSSGTNPHTIGHEKVIQPPVQQAAEKDPDESPYGPSLMPKPQQPQTPTDLGLPMPPPLPDFDVIDNAQAAHGSAYALPTDGPGAEPLLGDILAPEPPTSSSQTPDQPPVDAPPLSQPADTPPSNDPGQFKIPGQS